MNANMKVSEQCRILASKGNHVLGMIRRNIAYKEKKLIVPLYKTIVIPHLEYCIQAWSPYLKPATAFSLSGTVSAFTCDCLRFICAFTRRRKFDLCVSTSSRTMLAFGNNVSCSSCACSTKDRRRYA